MTNPIGPNSNSFVDRNGFPLEINGGDQKEAPLTISAVSQITGVTQTTFSHSTFENLNETYLVYSYDFTGIVLWPNVISYLGFKNLAKMQKICKLLHSVVKKDPAFQITKTLHLIANGLVTTAKELNDSLKNILLPTLSESQENVDYLIKKKEIKRKIDSSMTFYFLSLVNKKGAIPLLLFLNKNHSKFEEHAKYLINNLFLDNLLDYTDMEDKVLINPEYAELPEEFINHPENHFLKIIYSFKQLELNPSVIPEKISHQLDLINNLINNEDESSEEYNQRITDYRESIISDLNDPVFMSALFFLLNCDSGYAAGLVHLLFDNKIIEDKNLIFAVYRYEPEILKYASSTILKDFNFMNRLIHTFKNGLRAFQYADLTLRDSQDFVLPIVKIDGMKLEHVSPRLQNIFEVALTAVDQDGQALHYVGSDLQNNFQIVLTAVKQDGLAWKFASEALQKNREIYFTAVKKFYGVFPLLDPLYRNDEELVILALEGLVAASKIFTALYYPSYIRAIEKMWQSIDVSLRKDEKVKALFKEANRRAQVIKKEFNSLKLSSYKFVG